MKKYFADKKLNSEDDLKKRMALVLASFPVDPDLK